MHSFLFRHDTKEDDVQGVGSSPSRLLPGSPKKLTELEVGLRAFLPESWIEKPDARLDALRALSQCQDVETLRETFQGLRDRYGRAPAEAKELLRLFELKLPLDAAHVKHVAWHGDRYVIQYTDAVAFEHLFAGAAGGRGRRLDLRRIKPGVAHLVVPGHVAEKPPKAVKWFEGLLERAANAG